MKKLIIASAALLLLYAACKKKDDNVSILATVSYPIITFSGSQYYTIPVGGSLPDISATAYDTFYKQTCEVVIDKSTLDNTKPGLNIVYASAKNAYGMKSTKAVYVAVTNISPLSNLAGQYYRLSNNDTVNVTKLSTGLYRTDNVGGVLYSTSNAQFIIPAYFIQIDDSTIDLPMQETPLGSLYGADDSLSTAVGDTVYQYSIQGNDYFSKTIRQFKKL
ncbi:MAG: hypothetical protein EBX41_07780 [Chitinophagia bacterium]|nr:hypothetical protein [Chitinophagia bacterium]